MLLLYVVRNIGRPEGLVKQHMVAATICVLLLNVYYYICIPILVLYMCPHTAGIAYTHTYIYEYVDGVEYFFFGFYQRLGK